MSLHAPPTRPRRWWNARREQQAVRVAKAGAVLAVVALAVLGWWIVTSLLDAPGEQLAATCATGPASLGTVTAGEGGQGADALEPYVRAPAMTDLWLDELRAAAARADEPELSRRAFLARRADGPAAVEHLAEIERRCAEHMAAHGVEPAPADWFVP